MTTELQHRIDLLTGWLEQIRVVGDTRHALGKAARELLPAQTGLSRENVEWALCHSLEWSPALPDLSALVANSIRCETAHVLLSANVFASALRAIALALAGANTVFVRPSRREPTFATLLHEACPKAFTLVGVLSPLPGDHVWAYGSDETLHHLFEKWPSGVTVHAHGYGYGVVAIEEPERMSAKDYANLALDVAAFDQRGCLSPKAVAVAGSAAQTERVAQNLFSALKDIHTQMPLGVLSAAELHERARHRDLYRYLGHCYESEGCLVSVDLAEGPWMAAPGGRVIHVRRVTSVVDSLAEYEADLTTIGAQAPSIPRLTARFPYARVTPFGHMQTPRLDGPADRRTRMDGITIDTASRYGLRLRR